MLRAASALALAPAVQEQYSKPVLIATRASSASRAHGRVHQARRQAGKEWGEEGRALCVPVGPGGYSGTARSRPARGQTAGTPAYGEAAGRPRPCTSKQYDAPQDIYAGRAFEGVTTRGGLGGGLGIFPGKRDVHAPHNGSHPPSRHPSRALGKTALTRSQSVAAPASGRGVYDVRMRTSASGSLPPRPARTVPCSSCGGAASAPAAPAAAGAAAAPGLSRSGSALLGAKVRVRVTVRVTVTVSN